jgi:hypothetical protein
MTDYEIRIVRKGEKSPMVLSAKLLGDHAAVRRAHMLAGNGDLVEVWRRMTCVYSTVSEAAATY